MLDLKKNINEYSYNNYVGLFISVVASILILGWLLFYSGYGFEFTDEGFYLAWMKNPFIYSISSSQFGFIYHYLYEFLDGNITNLRRANILVTYTLSWLFLFLLLKNAIFSCKDNFLFLLVVSSSFSLVSLIIFDTRLAITPNYNTMVLHSILLTLIGLLLAAAEDPRVKIIGWVLVGVGGYLTFMAKPTSAALLSVITFFYVIVNKKLSAKFIVIPFLIACILFYFGALGIDGSVSDFLLRLKNAIEVGRLMGGGHTLLNAFRIDSLDLEGETHIALILIILLTIILLKVSSSEHKFKSYILNGFYLMSAVFIGMIVFVGTKEPIIDDKYQRILFLAVPLGIVFFVLWKVKFSVFLSLLQSKYAIVVLLIFSAYAFAFGTGSNYWLVGSRAAILWLSAGLIIMSPVLGREKNIRLSLLSLSILCQVLVVTMINTGFAKPYRQTNDLRANSFETRVGDGGVLRLSSSYGKYVSDAVKNTEQAGFKVGTAIIDFSGKSPGLLYAINAKNIIYAWMIGGYPGSDVRAEYLMNTFSCRELVSSWLLVEPESPRKIDIGLLEMMGLNLENDYQRAGEWFTAEGASGAWKSELPVPRIQLLYKPIRSVANAKLRCERTRKGK